eukprot:1375922-Amorphochlora_amoeboformis.AAC.1
MPPDTVVLFGCAGGRKRAWAPSPTRPSLLRSGGRRHHQGQSKKTERHGHGRALTSLTPSIIFSRRLTCDQRS